MVRRAPGAGDARVYDISGRRLAPLEASLSVGARSTAAQKRARRKLELQNADTDLIQDFEFPTVCTRVKTTPDGAHIFAAGTYPPQLHVYDTAELSLKFKRHVAADIVDFQLLEPSWRKFALVSADRFVDVHSPFGSHFRARVPRHPRDLMLHRASADLYVCGDGPHAYRLNLHHGRFLAPVPTRSGAAGNNVCAVSPVNSLLFFGGEAATVDVWDPRTAGAAQAPAGELDVLDALSAHDPATRRLARHRGGRPQITSIRCDESDGVSFAVGTSTGFTLLFDLRSPRALLARDQGNGLPIRSIRLHEDGTHCISADPKGVKVWDRRSAENMVTIEPDANLNHLCVVGNSGVMCAAVEAPRVKTYYIPALGPAPRWCAFLDTFTEELEDGRRKRTTDEAAVAGVEAGDDAELEEVYENYKFVSHGELEGLGLAHLVGTEMLKPYMHGYFVHQKLYRRAMEVSEPFAYEAYRKTKAREKLEAERESRITKKKSRKVKVKVNQKVVEAMEEKAKKGGKRAAAGLSLLKDDRFSAMFSNKDYAVEEDAERFQHLNPSGPAQDAGKETSDNENSDEEYLQQFELVDDEGNGSGAGVPSESEESDASSDGEASADDDLGRASDAQGKDDDGDGIAKERRKAPRNPKPPRQKGPRMYELTSTGELTRKHGADRKVGGMLRKHLREEVSLGARVSLREEQARDTRRGTVERTSRAKRT